MKTFKYSKRNKPLKVGERILVSDYNPRFYFVIPLHCIMAPEYVKRTFIDVGYGFKITKLHTCKQQH